MYYLHSIVNFEETPIANKVHLITPSIPNVHDISK